jgi:hypothetical protein
MELLNFMTIQQQSQKISNFSSTSICGMMSGMNHKFKKSSKRQHDGFEENEKTVETVDKENIRSKRN